VRLSNSLGAPTTELAPSPSKPMAEHKINMTVADTLNSFRAVYKIVDGHPIDAKIYLPNPREGKRIFPICKCQPWPEVVDVNLLTLIVINIHGGAFMLGSYDMVNKDQIRDCLSRSWIVVVPNHRLCPQVNLLEGPITDCRDLLAWIHSGGLDEAISSHTNDTGYQYRLDLNHVFAFGTSSGGTLALTLGFDVPHPVEGILDFYGPCDFADPFWTQEIPSLTAMLPTNLSDDFLQQVYHEKVVPIEGGVSLEGQAPGLPNFEDPRQAFAWSCIARGQVLKTVYPCGEWEKVDPIRNVSSSFPPTFIIHGAEDKMVLVELSRRLYTVLRDHGVQCEMREIPGEGHTFAARMKVGSSTWEMQREGFDFLEQLAKRAS